MKRFIIIVCIAVVVVTAVLYAVLVRGFYIDFDKEPPSAVFKTEQKEILIKSDEGKWESFDIKGVDIVTTVPGSYGSDYSVSYDEYTRWFELIAEMGANSVRIYTILDTDFYHAFYDYNTTHEKPLYLLQGIQVSDRANFGYEDIYHEDFRGILLKNGVAAVDVIHGRRFIPLGDVSGSGLYRWDISEWVIGYMVGTEWDSGNIAYLNNSTLYNTVFEGEFFKTGEEASRFEVVIAEIMDTIVSYESKKYEQQRLVTFLNDPQNDPFLYDDFYAARYLKYNEIDAENILKTDSLISGYFASYKFFNFCPDIVKCLSQEQLSELEDIIQNLDRSDTYNGYLDLLAKYHSMPVVAAGYGFSSSRAPIYENEPPLNEIEQGEAIVAFYADAKDCGWAGAFVSTWQDSWQRRTWNTAYSIYTEQEPTWQDVQTEGQCYGLMEFNLWEENSVCEVDGDTSEWTEEDIVAKNGDVTLSMKYDEKFIYFMVDKKDFDPDSDVFYIPIDTNPKLGSTYCEEYDVAFDRACEFVMIIDGRSNSRVVVSERYEVLWAMRAYELERVSPYDNVREINSPNFNRIYLVVQSEEPAPISEWLPAVTYETGSLRYGNANPDSEDFDSLADYIFTDSGVEIRIPWQLLNFSNPSEMMIHDDYYEHYGVENLHIDNMWVGVSDGENREYRISLSSFELKGWGKSVTYHERLKRSYYILKEYWTGS